MAKEFNEDEYLKEFADSLGRDVPDPTNPIPRTPIEEEPLDVWRAHRGESLSDVGRQVLTEALADAGIDLGAYDRRIVAWLGGFDLSAAVTVASWILRAHAAGGAQ